METQRQRARRHQELEWTILEIREALRNAGWLPPHSFRLRNLERTGRYRHVRAFHFRVGQPGLFPERNQADRLILYRECGYQMTYDDPVPGAPSGFWESLERQLASAVVTGYTQVEWVGRTFFDLGFLLGRAVRPFELGLTNEERREALFLDHRILHPYQGIVPLTPEPLAPGEALAEGGWVMESQGPRWCLKLVQYAKGGRNTGVVREIQWEDDPYLVNIAQQYLLLLLFRAQLPLSQQYRLSPQNRELFAQLVGWGPAHFPPAGTRYRCPVWMELIFDRGYY